MEDNCFGFCHPMWISHKYTYVPSLLDLSPTPHRIPSLSAVPEHCIEFLVLYNRCPLAVYFTCGNVYISRLLSQIPPFPTSHPQPTLLCPKSVLYIWISVAALHSPKWGDWQLVAPMIGGRYLVSLLSWNHCWPLGRTITGFSAGGWGKKPSRSRDISLRRPAQPEGSSKFSFPCSAPLPCSRGPLTYAAKMTDCDG